MIYIGLSVILITLIDFFANFYMGIIMRVGIAVMLVLVIFTAVPSYAASRTIVFYEVKQTLSTPKLDGKLDDPCWAEANRAFTYYEYFKSNPSLGKLKTEFRMLYNNKGIYLAIINYDKYMKKISDKMITRDNPDLWKDDCAEIYFDHEALGVGYAKFVVTARGIQGDSKRVDATISLPDWSAYGWRVKTSKQDKSWTIEAFFPWTDLGSMASQGDIWMFDHVRYAFTRGKFQGVTWAPGGNYMSPENFGYIYFAGNQTMPLELVGKLLSNIVTPPWSIVTKDGFISCIRPGNTMFTNAKKMLTYKLKALEASLKRVNSSTKVIRQKEQFSQILADISKEYVALPIIANTPYLAKLVCGKIAKLQKKINNVYWEVKIYELLSYK